MKSTLYVCVCVCVRACVGFLRHSDAVHAQATFDLFLAIAQGIYCVCVCVCVHACAYMCTCVHECVHACVWGMCLSASQD